MPITQERQTIQDLRAVGFTEQQSVVLAEKLELVAKAVSDDLKDFIRAENEKLRADLKAEFNARFGEIEARFGEIEVHFAQVDARFARTDSRIAQTEARFEHALRVQTATILSAFVAVTGLAVALIKWLP